MTPATHKYAAAAGSFCFSITEEGEQQDVCNLITMPSVQRSLYINEATNGYDCCSKKKTEVPDGVDSQTRDMLERCMTTCRRAAGTRAKMRSRARKEASAQEVRGYYKQFAEAKHLEYRSWVDNKVFDLFESLRKVKQKNCVTRRWVLTIKDRQAEQFPQGQGQMGTEMFSRQTKKLLTNWFSCFHNTWISDELPNGS